MAKNKNTRKPAQRAARSDRPQHRPDEAAQHQSTVAQVQGSPADVARNKQRRFGHN
ncbi:hypothetical protein [Streptomyces sp. UH6]|uniref:hypothetical protein n=1 Tax=Streptomyces sp. UH6 TaxID=2748379 RepID=UPI0015D4B07A|nr:hypothetical protein [Streptomyces sp. UH6]NYV76128.1 hypothetical protein [Streptomyces sp. UH6]